MNVASSGLCSEFQPHAVSHTHQGRQKELSVKTLRSSIFYGILETLRVILPSYFAHQREEMKKYIFLMKIEPITIALAIRKNLTAPQCRLNILYYL